MPYATLLFEQVRRVALITLNRPDRLNALSNEAVAELMAVVTKVESDPEIRVVVVTGAGSAFCAGGDLNNISRIKDDPELVERRLRSVHHVYRAIELSPKPWIAAINGLALAGGLELVLACDIAFAAREARLGDQHAKFGFVGGGGATQRLPRQIGLKRAKELMLSGDWVTAEEAERLGLVNRVIPATELLETAMQFAARLADRSPAATARMKRLINQGFLADLPQALELEIMTVTSHFASRDMAIGLDAFNKRIKPEFIGS